MRVILSLAPNHFFDHIGRDSGKSLFVDVIIDFPHFYAGVQQRPEPLGKRAADFWGI